MKLPLIDDPHGPFAMDVGTKASPSRMKYAGGSCVVITEDDIGDGPGTRRLPSYVASAAVRSTSMRWPGKPAIARSIEPASRVAGRDRRSNFVKLGLEKIVRDDQRLHRLPGIAAAGRDGLIRGGV